MSILFDDNISKMATALYPDSREQFHTADNDSRLSSKVGQGDRFLVDPPALAKRTRSHNIPRTTEISTQIWWNPSQKTKCTLNVNYLMIWTGSELPACMSSGNQSHKMVIMIGLSTSPTSKTVELCRWFDSAKLFFLAANLRM